MGALAGLVTYLAALAILLGAAFVGVGVVLYDPVASDPAAKQPPPLVRAADRKKQARSDEKTAAAPAPVPAVRQAAPAATAAPHPGAAELARKQARAAKPKKAGPKSRPPEIDDTAALGFAAQPRSFNSPFFR